MTDRPPPANLRRLDRTFLHSLLEQLNGYTSGTAREAAVMEPIQGELRFIRNKRSGRVHVVLPVVLDEDAEPEILSFAEAGPALLAMWARSTPVACGRELPGTSDIVMGQGPHLTDYEWVRAFADEDLCGACHRSLGDQSNLAFMHPVPGQEEE